MSFIFFYVFFSKNSFQKQLKTQYTPCVWWVKYEKYTVISDFECYYQLIQWNSELLHKVRLHKNLPIDWLVNEQLPYTHTHTQTRILFSSLILFIVCFVFFWMRNVWVFVISGVWIASKRLRIFRTFNISLYYRWMDIIEGNMK